LSADRGAGVRQALEDGVGVMQRNPNITQREKFGAVKTIEDALDTVDQVRAAMPGV
jgi:predicted RND superfamily exporter protein